MANYVAVIGAVTDAVKVTLLYFYTLYEYIYQGKSYTSCTTFQDDTWARVQIYSLSLIFKLWSKPHYRSPTFQQDMIDNLSNVAIPGTGVPLSVFCHSYYSCMFFIVIINPWICFFGAFNKARIEQKKTNSLGMDVFISDLVKFYKTHLLHPDDWFSLWRLNCRLVSYHSHLTQAKGYKQEDKWTFLTDGKALKVPVSPFITDLPDLVCKNKNIEGGMGIHFFKNAAFGGDWILQEKMVNSDWLNTILPSNSPLSTMRVITTSSSFLRDDKEVDDITSIKAVSAVLRLGRSGALTDHSSVLFDVGVPSDFSSNNNKKDSKQSKKGSELPLGQIQQGMTNAHWYKLGVTKAIKCSWLPEVGFESHPDEPKPVVTGKVIPGMKEALDIVISSHFKMMKDVPIVGWDVTFTPKGIFLLEVNLSCNFFRGSFNIEEYITFVDAYWKKLEKMETKN